MFDKKKYLCRPSSGPVRPGPFRRNAYIYTYVYINIYIYIYIYYSTYFPGPDRAGPGRPHAGPDGPPRAPNTYAGALGPPHMCLYPKTNFIKWIPIKLEKYSFFQKTSSFLVKTKVVELEILYKTGVTRPSRSLPNDSLCSKYFFYNIKKYEFFRKIIFLF